MKIFRQSPAMVTLVVAVLATTTVTAYDDSTMTEMDGITTTFSSMATPTLTSKTIAASEVDLPIFARAMATHAVAQWAPMPTSFSQCYNEPANPGNESYPTRRVNCTALADGYTWHFLSCDKECHDDLDSIIPGVYVPAGIASGILPVMLKNKELIQASNDTNALKDWFGTFLDKQISFPSRRLTRRDGPIDKFRKRWKEMGVKRSRKEFDRMVDRGLVAHPGDYSTDELAVLSPQPIPGSPETEQWGPSPGEGTPYFNAEEEVAVNSLAEHAAEQIQSGEILVPQGTFPLVDAANGNIRPLEPRPGNPPLSKLELPPAMQEFAHPHTYTELTGLRGAILRPVEEPAVTEARSVVQFMENQVLRGKTLMGQGVADYVNKAKQYVRMARGWLGKVVQKVKTPLSKLKLGPIRQPAELVEQTWLTSENLRNLPDGPVNMDTDQYSREWREVIQPQPERPPSTISDSGTVDPDTFYGENPDIAYAKGDFLEANRKVEAMERNPPVNEVAFREAQEEILRTKANLELLDPEDEMLDYYLMHKLQRQGMQNRMGTTAADAEPWYDDTVVPSSYEDTEDPFYGSEAPGPSGEGKGTGWKGKEPVGKSEGTTGEGRAPPAEVEPPIEAPPGVQTPEEILAELDQVEHTPGVVEQTPEEVLTELDNLEGPPEVFDSAPDDGYVRSDGEHHKPYDPQGIQDVEPIAADGEQVTTGQVTGKSNAGTQETYDGTQEISGEESVYADGEAVDETVLDGAVTEDGALLGEEALGGAVESVATEGAAEGLLEGILEIIPFIPVAQKRDEMWGAASPEKPRANLKDTNTGDSTKLEHQTVQQAKSTHPTSEPKETH